MDSFSSYHPAINFLYFTVVLLVTMFMMQPVFLAISCVCAYAYSIYLKGKKALKFNFLYMLPVLLIAALIVFVLGAALQRLGWERALERYLHREKPPKEEKPAKTKPEKAKKPEKKAAPAAGEATDQLLSSMKKRKRM